MPVKRVIVIGGGFAGLSAATALAQKGCRVTVLEGRQVLGGRAYSFVDPVTGDSVDNGQHLFMGCYYETQTFLERLQATEGLEFQSGLQIPFVGSGGRNAELHCLSLPAPWHLYSGFLRLKTLSWSDRWRLRLVQDALKQNESTEALDRLTVDEWLIRSGQSEEARRHLWDLITIACLNEDSRIASAAPFVAVLKQAFFEDRKASQLAFAHVGLSELYVPQAVKYLEDRGGEVRVKAPVQRLEMEGGQVVAVRLRSDERIEADAVIAAVPPWALTKLVPDEWLKQPYFESLNRFSYSPIISVHLWFNEEITRELFVGLLDTQIQWLFNRSRIHQDPKTKSGHISLVISGAHAFANWDDKKILSMALEELKRLFPKARRAALVRSLVIKESHATLSLKVGTDALRPTSLSPIKQFFVAGDWVKTGLPATIESACKSGHACAELVHQQQNNLTSSPAGASGGSIMLDPGLRTAGVTA
jgi:hydroxysqualene dehydroxylase